MRTIQADAYKYSKKRTVQSNADKYFNRSNLKPRLVERSSRANKKYMVLDDNNKIVHFGVSNYEDYTVHKDEQRREAYLKRATAIKGNWKDNPFSPNSLSINLLWQ